MSRISELEFYNDKDVITQIEWLKKNVGGNLIESLEVKEITDPESTDFGKTDIIIHMENGDTHEASYVSALVKSVDTRQEGDDVILAFNLATGDKFETRFTVSVHATAAWDSLEGTPRDSVPLTEWMNEKAEATDLTAEETARTNADNALTQRITNLDEDVAGEIARMDGEIAQEITARTEADALKEDKANKVATWSATPSDDKYPSEKLVYDTLLTKTTGELELIPVSGLNFEKAIFNKAGIITQVDLAFSTTTALNNVKFSNTVKTSGFSQVNGSFNGIYYSIIVRTDGIYLSTSGAVSPALWTSIIFIGV